MKLVTLAVFLSFSISAFAEVPTSLPCATGKGISVSTATSLAMAAGDPLSEGVNELFVLVISNDDRGPIKIDEINMLLSLEGGVRVPYRSLFAHEITDLKQTNDVSRRDAPLIVRSGNSMQSDYNDDDGASQMVTFERLTRYTNIAIMPGEKKVFAFHGTAENIDEHSSASMNYQSLWWMPTLGYNCNELENLRHLHAVALDLEPTRLVAQSTE